MTILDKLAEFVAKGSAQRLPPVDRAILRRHMMDVVSARIAGERCSVGRIVGRFLAADGSAEGIARLSTLVRLTETDDIHLPSGTTPSSISVPVALGMARAHGCAADELESAIYVATDLIVRLGMAIGGAGVLYRGLWPTRSAATLGAVAAAGRVLGLTVDQARHALSLAVIMTSGRTGRFHTEPSGRWIIFASSVGAGVTAARAAKAGFVGDPAVVDKSWLEKLLGVPVDLEPLTEGLATGSVFPQLSLKPYCTSRQALGGAEAMRNLVQEGLDPETISRFRIAVPSAYAGMISQRLDPAMRPSSYVSGTGLSAIAAIDPDALYDVERDAVLSNGRVLALASKGEVIADPALDSYYPNDWPARIEVDTSSGTLIREALAPIGSPAHPISDAQIEDKAGRILGLCGRPDAVEALVSSTRAAFSSDAAAMDLAGFFVGGGRTAQG